MAFPPVFKFSQIFLWSMPSPFLGFFQRFCLLTGFVTWLLGKKRPSLVLDFLITPEPSESRVFYFNVCRLKVLETTSYVQVQFFRLKIYHKYVYRITILNSFFLKHLILFCSETHLWDGIWGPQEAHISIFSSKRLCIFCMFYVLLYWLIIIQFNSITLPKRKYLRSCNYTVFQGFNNLSGK